MAEFQNRLKRENACAALTVSDAELKPICVGIERGLSVIEDCVRELVQAKWETEVEAQHATLTLLFAWNLHQLAGGYSAALHGNYAAAVSNLRQGFEGTVFMRKYAGNRSAAEKWLADPNYEDDTVHAVLKELLKKPRGAKLASYAGHYKVLSRLAHPYPSTRSLFLEENKSHAAVSLGGRFNKRWAAIMLSEALFIVGQCLEIMAPALAQAASVELQQKLAHYRKIYLNFYPIVSRYLRTFRK